MKSERTNNLEQTLIKCITACESCATLCLQEEDIQMMVKCIQNDRDCADVCTLTARLVARNSPHARHILKECIEVCQNCHDECIKHEHDHCQQCAKACRECLEACKAWLENAAVTM